MKKKIFLIVLSTLIFFVVLGIVLFQISKSRTFQFFGGLTARVETSEKVVAFTFDDAPTQYTNEVLETLKDKQVKATFFVIGDNMKKEPAIAKAIVADGHQLGNHSYTHDRFYFKSQSFIAEEIQKTNKTIRDAGYKGEITFRPPNGKKLVGLPWYLKQHGMKTIMWDVEPDTYVGDLQDDAKEEFLVNYTIEHTKPGSIILLHPFCESCVEERAAIGEIIERLKHEGFTFVTVSELLTYQQ